MTLTEFLLARIAEDEAAAERAGSFTPWSETFQNDNYGHLTIQPDRVLAECEAKRRIVSWASHGEGEFHWDTVLGPLAAVYADHPDYDESWRP